MADRLNALAWQTWRVLTAGDTLLTAYKPSDVVTAVKAKMIGVYPYAAVLVRAFGKDTDDDTISNIVISGWMDVDGRPDGPGIGAGFRLWSGDLILGSKSFAEVPTNDRRWSAGTWFEVDTWTDNSPGDTVGTTILNSTNQESCMIVPTLGFTHLLVEVPAASMGGAGEATEVGFMWRPVSLGGKALVF